MADLPNELLFNAFLSTGNKDEESRKETELGSDEKAQEQSRVVQGVGATWCLS